MTSTKVKEEDSVDSCRVRFVTYNVLSSSLCSPSWYPKCPAEDLDPKNRLSRVLSKLKRRGVDEDAIVGLQEVSLTWRPTLKKWFNDNGYDFICTNYGNAHNDFMGVALAFPRKRYEAKRSEIVCVGRANKWKRKPRVPTPGRFQVALRTIFDVIKHAVSSLLLVSVWTCIGKAVGLISDKPSRPERSDLEVAKGRFNRQIMASIRCKKSDRLFNVAVYHMPCVFWNQRLVTICAALSAQCANAFASKDEDEPAPTVMLGDWNFGPDTAAYSLLTKGTLDTAHPGYPNIPSHETWRPEVGIVPSRSAYAEFEGEPAFTNRTCSGKVPQVFTGVLDFIFYSANRDVRVVDVLDVPRAFDDDTPLLPNASEPSDHLMIGATLEFGAPQDS